MNRWDIFEQLFCVTSTIETSSLLFRQDNFLVIFIVSNLLILLKAVYKGITDREEKYIQKRNTIKKVTKECKEKWENRGEIRQIIGVAADLSDTDNLEKLYAVFLDVLIILFLHTFLLFFTWILGLVSRRILLTLSCYWLHFQSSHGGRFYTF